MILNSVILYRAVCIINYAWQHGYYYNISTCMHMLLSVVGALWYIMIRMLFNSRMFYS